MDDMQIYAPTGLPREEVVLGTYGSEEWIFADHLRRRYLAGMSTLEIEENWLTPSDFKLAKWVIASGFKSFTFMTARTVIIPTEDGIMKVNQSKGKIEVNLTGDPQFCAKWVKHFDSQMQKAENLIKWVYNSNGDSIMVPLNYRPAIQAAYPWLRAPVSEYVSSYLDSDASVLILIGPPGTGKTTLIKNLIHQSGGNAMVTYDEKVMQTDDFFANFIDNDTDILVIEDADTFLSSREEGNTMMHKFLNVSDGLISAKRKKIIFSTNLPNISDIDSALLRTGRCHDVVQFRPLTRDEAQEVLDEVGVDQELPDGNELTLAEIFTSQPIGDKPVKRKIGF